MKQLRIRFVVADGGRARFVDREGDAPLYRTVRAVEAEAAGLRARDLGAHRPDRVHESVGSTRHAIEPRVSPDDERRHRFARLIGRIARRDRASGQCDVLGIVAPSDLLKDIEAGLGGEAQLGPVRRDLTKTHDEDLPEHLEPAVRAFYRKRRMATAE
jgi:hypothetical protein